MLSTEQLCNHLIHLLHAPIRCYNQQKIPLTQHKKHKQQDDPVIQDPSFEDFLLTKANDQFPVLHFEFNAIVYGVIKTPTEGYFILGPCSLVSDNKNVVQKIAKAHHISPQYRISFCSAETFCSICGMLFHHCTGIDLNWNEIMTLNACKDVLAQSVEKEINNVAFSYQEQFKVHNPYEQEQREQNSIRNGDMEGLKKSFEETYVGEVGTLAKTPLRNSQNIAITLIALASRSAIEGGISPEIAYTISDSYVMQIEETVQPPDALSLARQAEIYYASMVAEHQKELEKNSLTARCKNYVKHHICEKIRVCDIAAEFGINPNYLSSKFTAEEGISLVHYINSQKIEFSKQRLRFSDEDYDTIAYAFGFSSQSHFTSVFKKIVGITPKQYRDKFR
jgi:AraC-like DNA-binding protein